MLQPDWLSHKICGLHLAGVPACQFFSSSISVLCFNRVFACASWTCTVFSVWVTTYFISSFPFHLTAKCVALNEARVWFSSESGASPVSFTKSGRGVAVGLAGTSLRSSNDMSMVDMFFFWLCMFQMQLVWHCRRPSWVLHCCPVGMDWQVHNLIWKKIWVKKIRIGFRLDFEGKKSSLTQIIFEWLVSLLGLVL